VLNKQKKGFKDSLVLLLKSFIMFVSITVVYKGFSISVKFKLELVIEEALIKTVFSKVASFG
jgi:hypothetical protein